MELICVPPDEVYKIWPGKVHDLIDSAFAARDVPMPDDIAEQLKYGTRLLWLAVTAESMIVAAMLTQLFEMRSSRVCKMMECGGDQLAGWISFRSRIEQYAKAEGCDRVIVEGRRGWSRALDDYRVVSVVMEKRI